VNTVNTECLDCGAPVTIAADAMLGEILTCPDCGVELEVVELDPLILHRAPLEMEDWGE
jgi:alpha-aminoadipate carrier protein LysW